MESNGKWVLISIAFNLFWLLMVLGQDEYLWLGAFFLLASWFASPDSALFALLIAVQGILMDVILGRLGVFSFDSVFIPLWLVILWLGFATFIWHVRDQICDRSPGLIVLLGGAGGMMSYLAGARLGAVTLPWNSYLTASILFACWVLFSALILLWLKHYKKMSGKEAGV
ncbi:DUF2878 domain-containing protein [Endozoicomonas arenosclerae]|uniref:DUF2878 domain-containing protein n=1 Tax=Endozoicomonas arenosclerae TaxID=1633495 RepID=UPI0007802BB9|nr:DUF2878 domain-containing protein [Endozoicomonas arenosclerae]